MFCVLEMFDKCSSKYVHVNDLVFNVPVSFIWSHLKHEALQCGFSFYDNTKKLMDKYRKIKICEKAEFLVRLFILRSTHFEMRKSRERINESGIRVNFCVFFFYFRCYLFPLQIKINAQSLASTWQWQHFF